MNTQLTDYIKNAPDEQRKIMESIRKLIHESVPGVIEEFKWSRPVFKLKKDFAYLKANKNNVNLGFMTAQKINDTRGLLEGTGKDMRHIKLKTMNDVDGKLLQEWFVAVTKE